MFNLFRFLRFLDRNRPWRKPRLKAPRKVWTFRPMLEILEDRLTPTTCVVTNTSDAGFGTGPDANGVYSGDLNYCIQQVNKSTDAQNLIVFGSGVSGTIDVGDNPLPAIQRNVTISNATGNSITVSGDGQQRVFDIGSVTAEIDGLTITGGSINGNGGGIYNVSGNLTLKNDEIYQNSAAFEGGGIYNGSGATLNLSSCKIWENTADTNGGGIANYGTVTDSGSSLLANIATQFGGGYYSNQGGQGIANLTGTTLDGNLASVGGGVYNATTGQFSLTNGSIANNTATGSGGGVYVSSSTVLLTGTGVSGNTASAGSGGGVKVVYNGNFTMHGGGIGMNKAYRNGGGLANDAGTVLLDQNCTVGNNTAGSYGGGVYSQSTTTLNSVMVMGNTAGNNGGGIYVGNGSSMTSLTTVTVQGNTSTNGQGNGIYWQNGGGDNLTWSGLTDTDDPNGAPVQGP
jgi:hypothetical protein